jgi:hypothetical protein
MYVSCFPNTVVINATTDCVASVSNAEDFAVPTGSVIFSTNSTGTFSTTSCDLGASASCSVFYTPGYGSKGAAMITAKYSGDLIHAPNSAVDILTVT